MLCCYAGRAHCENEDSSMANDEDDAFRVRSAEDTKRAATNSLFNFGIDFMFMAANPFSWIPRAPSSLPDKEMPR